MLLHGILPPITTPFYPDGQVYYKKLEHNVERFSRTPSPESWSWDRPGKRSCYPIRSGGMS